MLTKTFDIELNTKIGAIAVTDITVNQGDTESVIFNFRIYEGVRELDYGLVDKALLFLEKPDRNIVQLTALPVGGGRGFTATMSRQALAAPGRVAGILALYGHSGERISTLGFHFAVERDFVSAGVVESLPEFDALMRAVWLLERTASLYARFPRGVVEVVGTDHTAGQLHEMDIRIGGVVVSGGYLHIAGHDLEPGELLVRIADTASDEAWERRGSIRGLQGEPGRHNPRGLWDGDVGDYQKYDVVVYGEGTWNTYIYTSTEAGLRMPPNPGGHNNPWQVWAYRGASGENATIEIGKVTTGGPGTGAAVENTGTPTNATLDFTVPKGDTGRAATLNVGYVKTGEPGTDAAVENAGSESEAVLNFTIPRGLKGDRGDPGGIGEAPVDGQLYGRADAGWAVATAGRIGAATADAMPTAAIIELPITHSDYFSAWELLQCEGGINAPLEAWGFTNAVLTTLPSRMAVNINTNTITVYTIPVYGGLTWSVNEYQSGVFILTAKSAALILIRR